MSGGLSDEEKETRRVLNKATKKLLKLKHNVDAILEEMAGEGEALQATMDRMDSNIQEVRTGEGPWTATYRR